MTARDDLILANSTGENCTVLGISRLCDAVLSAYCACSRRSKAMRSLAAIGFMVIIPASVSISRYPDADWARNLKYLQGLAAVAFSSTANSS